MSRIADANMSQELYDIISDGLGQDVASAYKLIMGFGNNKIERLLHAAGEKILMRHEEFLRNLEAKRPDIGGLKSLRNLIITALNTLHENTPATDTELLEIPMSPIVKDIQASIRISRREVKTETVRYKNWALIYMPDGWYRITKDGKEVASGKYDAVIADSYNNQMTSEDRQENLNRDLISWIEKAIKGKVTN